MTARTHEHVTVDKKAFGGKPARGKGWVRAIHSAHWGRKRDDDVNSAHERRSTCTIAAQGMSILGPAWCGSAAASRARHAGQGGARTSSQQLTARSSCHDNVQDAHTSTQRLPAPHMRAARVILQLAIARHRATQTRDRPLSRGTCRPPRKVHSDRSNQQVFPSWLTVRHACHPQTNQHSRTSPRNRKQSLASSPTITLRRVTLPHAHTRQEHSPPPPTRTHKHTPAHPIPRTPNTRSACPTSTPAAWGLNHKPTHTTTQLDPSRCSTPRSRQAHHST